MIVHHLSENNSILNHFLSQIRDVEVQKDGLRFRKNMERIGEIMAYEISKVLPYQPHQTKTPLGTKDTFFVKDKIVVCSIYELDLRFMLVLLHFLTKLKTDLFLPTDTIIITTTPLK